MIDALVRGSLGTTGSGLLDFYIQNSLWINALLFAYADFGYYCSSQLWSGCPIIFLLNSLRNMAINWREKVQRKFGLFY